MLGNINVHNYMAAFNRCVQEMSTSTSQQIQLTQCCNIYETISKFVSFVLSHIQVVTPFKKKSEIVRQGTYPVRDASDISKQPFPGASIHIEKIEAAYLPGVTMMSTVIIPSSTTSSKVTHTYLVKVSYVGITTISTRWNENHHSGWKDISLEKDVNSEI